MDDEENEKMTCVSCRRDIDLGNDVLSLERGVVGPRGFVPLGDIRLFCSESCAEEYFDGDEPTEKVKRPRQVP